MPDPECGNTIYWNGYYGSFLGVEKPRERNIDAPLELSLIEALYLVEKNAIVVMKGDRVVGFKELYEKGVELIDDFHELYRVYRDLRERGLVVRRGLKFGCDYLVYRLGPGIEHAPYGVEVIKINHMYDPINIVRMGRLLHSVRKKLVLSITDGDKVDYVLLDWWKP